MTDPITDQQLDLDEIETRAAHLHEYALLDDEPMQADADQLTGKDVPALVAAVRRLRAELAAVHAFLDEQDRAARLFELPTPEWVKAVRAASVPSVAPVSAPQPSSVSESAQSPTGAPEGALKASGLTAPPRRTLTPGEYDAAWHAVEGAAGDEGADPGTVLHTVLDRLGIEWQDAAKPTVTTTPAR